MRPRHAAPPCQTSNPQGAGFGYCHGRGCVTVAPAQCTHGSASGIDERRREVQRAEPRSGMGVQVAPGRSWRSPCNRVIASGRSHETFQHMEYTTEWGNWQRAMEQACRSCWRWSCKAAANRSDYLRIIAGEGQSQTSGKLVLWDYDRCPRLFAENGPGGGARR